MIEMSLDDYIGRFYSPALAEKAKSSKTLAEFLRYSYEGNLALWNSEDDDKEEEDDAEVEPDDKSLALQNNLTNDDLMALIEAVPSIYAKMAYKAILTKRQEEKKAA